jgi:hypothetical protein
MALRIAFIYNSKAKSIVELLQSIIAANFGTTNKTKNICWDGSQAIVLICHH